MYFHPGVQCIIALGCLCSMDNITNPSFTTPIQGIERISQPHDSRMERQALTTTHRIQPTCGQTKGILQHGITIIMQTLGHPDHFDTCIPTIGISPYSVALLQINRRSTSNGMIQVAVVVFQFEVIMNSLFPYHSLDRPTILHLVGATLAPSLRRARLLLPIFVPCPKLPELRIEGDGGIPAST